MGERTSQRSRSRTALISFGTLLLGTITLLDVQTARAEQPGNRLTQSTERNPDIRRFIMSSREPRTLVLNGTILSLGEAAGAILRAHPKTR